MNIEKIIMESVTADAKGVFITGMDSEILYRSGLENFDNAKWTKWQNCYFNDEEINTSQEWEIFDKANDCCYRVNSIPVVHEGQPYLVHYVNDTHEYIDLFRGLSDYSKGWQEMSSVQKAINERLSFQIVQALADAIDAKDAYTNGHSRRVAIYAQEVARRYGYSEERQNEIYMMALLHDVGKISIPDAVINKPSKLTDEEFGLIKNHTVAGFSILKNIEEMPKLSIGARWHHERYSGGGYPDSLQGEEIPEEARIIAVADSYDAMASKRSYRDALPQKVVREEIEKGKGTQFDPKFADIFLQMIDDDKEYRMKEQSELD